MAKMDEKQTLSELGRRLQACRAQAGLTSPQLAERAQLKPGQIEGFEEGRGGLGMADVVRLARALGVPRASFLHPSAPVPRAFQDPHILLLNHATASLESKDLDALVSGLVRAGRFAEALALDDDPLPLAEDRELFALIPPPPEQPHASGYERARLARLRLAAALPARVPLEGPLKNLRRLIEDHLGILVVEHRFKTSNVVEASCRRGPARLIALDPGQPETSRRWALSHGLAHQLLDLREEDGVADELHDGGRFSLEKRPKEKRADAFAAMFIAPKEAVESVLKGRSTTASLSEARQAVQDCRRQLGLNFIPMLRQLQDLNKITLKDADALVGSPGTESIIGFEDSSAFDGLGRKVLKMFHEGSISRGRARELDPDLNSKTLGDLS